ncbi:hypothetical protein [Haladaptatus halobius]|uniref:hypothetical protein n=1 Tax=Haladaptatus halobius TaxID=2884875 RepID=UPI001D0B62D5|nr:hypothetical protein [Haladaptatus halobius]
MHIHDDHEVEVMSVNERVLWASGHGLLLLLVLGGTVFVSGYWAIILALGPAAYLLALDAHSSDNAPAVVIISYTAALGVGWVAYMALAQGIAPTAVEPMSEPALRVIGSAFVALAGTTGVFYLLNTLQPMAYVATFAAAIGSFPTIQSLVIAALAVLLMAGIQAVRRRYGPESAASPEAINGRPSET